MKVGCRRSEPNETSSCENSYLAQFTCLMFWVVKERTVATAVAFPNQNQNHRRLDILAPNETSFPALSLAHERHFACANTRTSSSGGVRSSCVHTTALLAHLGWKFSPRCGAKLNALLGRDCRLAYLSSRHCLLNTIQTTTTTTLLMGS